MVKRMLCCGLLFPAWPLEAYPGSPRAQEGSSSTLSAAIKPFLGRWDLSIQSPSRELPSWIEVSEEQGHPKVVMVGLTDHATELKKSDVKEGQLEFLSPKGEEGFRDDTLFKGKVVGGLDYADGRLRRLVGVATTPGGTSWHWTGRPAPTLKRSEAPQWGKPITLFDGKDFSGWRFGDAKHANWTVEDGTLVNNGHGADIITTSRFEDFKLHLEFNRGPKSNSGVYLRGRYELQIETDSAAEPPSHHTGGVYGFLDSTPELARQAGVWQIFDITLIGRTITVVQNAQTVIDHKEIPGITGGFRQPRRIARTHLPAGQRRGPRCIPQSCDYARGIARPDSTGRNPPL